MYFYGTYIRPDGGNMSFLKGEINDYKFNFQNCSGRNTCIGAWNRSKTFGQDEQAFLVSLAGLILVFLWIVPYIEQLFETVEKLFSIG